MKKKTAKSDFRFNNKGNPVDYKGYAEKIRNLVIKAYYKNIRLKTIAQRYEVQVSTIYRWLKLQKETNSLAPRTNFKPGKPSRIKDKDLKAYVQKNPDDTLKKTADFFQCSPSWIARCLKRLNITRKKKLYFYAGRQKERRGISKGFNQNCTKEDYLF